MIVNKAVFPVAGLGTRFLPATRATPKEMLPIVDTPLIQYAVDEAERAGITHMIFVTRAGKRTIEDHFDIDSKNIAFTWVRQYEPLGLGHALLCARHVVGNDPFAVLLADDLIDDRHHPCLGAMTEYFAHTGKSVLAAQEVPMSEVFRYGIVKLAESNKHFAKITGIVEKPRPEVAPSRFAAVGRYIFTPVIFDYLQQVLPDSRGEIQLTDAIRMMVDYDTVYASIFDGMRYDCGSKLGYLQATVAYGMRHEEIGAKFLRYLHSLASSTIT